MIKFIFKRILMGILVVIGVSFLQYTLLRLLPSDFIEKQFMGTFDLTPEKINALKNLYGLNGSIVKGYLTWFFGMLKGDFGVSFTDGRSVKTLIAEKLPFSFSLSLAALIMELCVAVPLGVAGGIRKKSLKSRTAEWITVICMSLPAFFTGGLLQLLFFSGLKILPLSGALNAKNYIFLSGAGKLGDILLHLLLPLSVLVISGFGRYFKSVKNNVASVMKERYILNARLKGMSEKKTVKKHALKNSLTPVLTSVGGSLPSLFSGAMITETLFSLPGLGLLSYERLMACDIPFVMAFNLLLAILTVAGSILSDCLYAAFNPEVRF